MPGTGRRLLCLRHSGLGPALLVARAPRLAPGAWPHRPGGAHRAYGVARRGHRSCSCGLAPRASCPYARCQAGAARQLPAAVRRACHARPHSEPPLQRWLARLPRAVGSMTLSAYHASASAPGAARAGRGAAAEGQADDCPRRELARWLAALQQYTAVEARPAGLARQYRPRRCAAGTGRGLATAVASASAPGAPGASRPRRGASRWSSGGRPATGATSWPRPPTAPARARPVAAPPTAAQQAPGGGRRHPGCCWLL